MNSVLSVSAASSVGQPNHASLPRPFSIGLPSGFEISGTIQLVMNMFQPPSAGAAWLARRVTSVCQSIGCNSTVKPASRSIWAMTTGWACNATMSVGCMMTTGVPS